MANSSSLGSLELWIASSAAAVEAHDLYAVLCTHFVNWTMSMPTMRSIRTDMVVGQGSIHCRTFLGDAMLVLFVDGADEVSVT